MFSGVKIVEIGSYAVSSVNTDSFDAGGAGAEGMWYGVPGAGTRGEGNDCRLASEAVPGNTSGDADDGVDGKS